MYKIPVGVRSIVCGSSGERCYLGIKAAQLSVGHVPSVPLSCTGVRSGMSQDISLPFLFHVFFKKCGQHVQKQWLFLKVPAWDS